jgi:hypothetical protein
MWRSFDGHRRLGCALGYSMREVGAFRRMRWARTVVAGAFADSRQELALP